jgi:hypothetical protein
MLEKGEFQRAIRAAMASPKIADVWALWDSMVASVQGHETRMQLDMVGDGYLSIVEVVERRAGLFLVREELGGEAEPMMPEDAFSPFVRQHMDIDFSSFVEGVARKEHDYPDSRVIVSGEETGEIGEWLEGVEEGSLIEEGDVEALEHDEDVNAWAEAIRGWMMANNFISGSISEIVDATQLSPSKAWLAGLLNVNEFELKQENEEDFYSYDGLILKTETVVQCEVA